MSILKTTTTWAGSTGLPGYTNLFFDASVFSAITDIPKVADAVADFWAEMGGILPGGVTLTTSPEIQQIDEVSGDLETLWAISPAPTVINGGGSGIGPAPAGGCISWNTGEVHAGRVVRGRTFIVPLALNVFQSDGTLTSGCVTAMNAAAVTLIAHDGPPFVIWARPREVPTHVDGAAFAAVTGTARDRVAVLRSRRD